VLELVIEASQIKADGSKYFTKYYNIFDIIVIIAHFTFLIVYFLTMGGVIVEEKKVDGWDDRTLWANQILTIVVFPGIYRGIVTAFRQWNYTRFLTYMV
jgi:hypothetical protein